MIVPLAWNAMATVQRTLQRRELRTLAILAVPTFALALAITTVLPSHHVAAYALLMPMMPRRSHGAVTGLYSLSRGLGTSLGPLFGGVAVQLAGHDYRRVWAVCAPAILASTPATAPLRDDA
jgi:MFS family permease